MANSIANRGQDFIKALDGISEAELAKLYNELVKPKLVEGITKLEGALSPETIKETIAMAKGFDGDAAYKLLVAMKTSPEAAAKIAEAATKPELAELNLLVEKMTTMPRKEFVAMFDTHIKPKISATATLIESTLQPGGLKEQLTKAKNLTGSMVALGFGKIKDQLVPVMPLLHANPETAELHGLLERAIKMPRSEVGRFFDDQVKPKLAATIEKLETHVPEGGVTDVFAKLKNLTGEEVAKAVMAEKDRIKPTIIPLNSTASIVSNTTKVAEHAGGGKILLAVGAVAAAGIAAIELLKPKPAAVALNGDAGFKGDADIKVGAVNRPTPGEMNWGATVKTAPAAAAAAVA